MRLQVVTFILVASSLLVGCGDDQANSRRNGKAASPTTPGLASDESVIVSGISRERGVPQITYNSEAATTAAAYRFVPDMSRDSESGMNLSSTILGRPNMYCGTDDTLKSISARIADCESKNKLLASWKGATNGTSAEADWNLVAYTADGKEVWQDQRTKAIWSYIIAKGNWCQASGNNQSPDGIVTVDCATSIPADEAASLCVGLEIPGLVDLIQWRLPTRTDYLQADVDGIRSVVSTKDLDANGLWTATMDSATADRSKAWVYGQKQGTLTAESLLSVRQVRCIGTPK